MLPCQHPQSILTARPPADTPQRRESVTPAPIAPDRLHAAIQWFSAASTPPPIAPVLPPLRRGGEAGGGGWRGVGVEREAGNKAGGRESLVSLHCGRESPVSLHWHKASAPAHDGGPPADAHVPPPQVPASLKLLTSQGVEMRPLPTTRMEAPSREAPKPGGKPVVLKVKEWTRSKNSPKVPLLSDMMDDQDSAHLDLDQDSAHLQPPPGTKASPVLLHPPTSLPPNRVRVFY
jgi:hypothetical protein